jgi:predicted patatin/cPLA2 family phospholipase
MNSITNNLQNLIKQVINQHTPLKITNQDGADFVVISAEDWDNRKLYLFCKIIMLWNKLLNLCLPIAQIKVTFPQTKNSMRYLVFEGNTWEIYEELGQKDKNLHKNLNDLRDAYHPISILTIKNSD